MYMPRELWYNILEYTGPKGQLKYTCHEFLEISIELFMKFNMRGDDILTDSTIVNNRFKTVNSKVFKYIIRTTKNDMYYIAMCKQTWLDKDTILGTIVSNKYITNRCRKYVLMNIVGKNYGHKNTIKSIIERLYELKNYEMLQFMICQFYTRYMTHITSLIFRLGFKLISFVDNGYMTPREYYDMLLSREQYYISDMSDLLNKYPDNILREDDSQETINKLMSLKKKC